MSLAHPAESRPAREAQEGDLRPVMVPRLRTAIRAAIRRRQARRRDLRRWTALAGAGFAVCVVLGLAAGASLSAWLDGREKLPQWSRHLPARPARPELVSAAVKRAGRRSAPADGVVVRVRTIAVGSRR